ncbi:MAG TPA: bifunctional DNA-binding transcriptional regulator/O6-methylguanine-DNA methyltransferase Ada [Terriglobia bacterium]|nr:bifunctional DNA-binding transcriptional regulator/O6-methylguanine-DNA methyltransferase Ada [Terriglobia bacterium]
MGALEVMKLAGTKREARQEVARPQLVGRGDHADGRWQAVAQRDGRFDGAFVYAVRSTGIYCRPSCPSRRPQPEQVVFFLAPDAAEQAGFRACRRCRPREIAMRHPHVELVERACRAIETCMDDTGEGRLSLDALGAAVGVSPHHLQRTFKRVMGITPRQYADARRLGDLKARLKEGKDVTTALYDAGYGSSSRLYERSSTQLGMTPGTYRHGGRGMSIHYTIVDCPLGRLLVAATERGVAAVSLGDADAPLEAALHQEYPHAEIVRAGSNGKNPSTGLAHAVSAIVAHLEGSQPRLDLPVDLLATAFQRRVWQELRDIPYGSTRSYREVASAIGRPKAVRAVARACATNPACIVIPCHRVVRTDGGLGGYRWGIERKRELIAKESRKGSRRVEC